MAARQDVWNFYVSVVGQNVYVDISITNPKKIKVMRGLKKLNKKEHQVGEDMENYLVIN